MLVQINRRSFHEVFFVVAQLEPPHALVEHVLVGLVPGRVHVDVDGGSRITASLAASPAHRVVLDRRPVAGEGVVQGLAESVHFFLLVLGVADDVGGGGGDHAGSERVFNGDDAGNVAHSLDGVAEGCDVTAAGVRTLLGLFSDGVGAGLGELLFEAPHLECLLIRLVYEADAPCFLGALLHWQTFEEASK